MCLARLNATGCVHRPPPSLPPHSRFPSHLFGCLPRWDRHADSFSWASTFTLTCGSDELVNNSCGRRQTLYTLRSARRAAQWHNISHPSQSPLQRCPSPQLAEHKSVWNSKQQRINNNQQQYHWHLKLETEGAAKCREAQKFFAQTQRSTNAHTHTQT